MSINIEEIAKLSPKLGQKQDFEKIVNSLDIKFDYNKTLFEENIKYRNQARYQLIKEVTNVENDKDKLILLYSLRSFFGEYRNIKDMRELVISIKDKSLIPEIIEHLDNEKQIEDMSNMIDYLSKGQALSQEESQEINEKLMSEIQKRKQSFQDKKDQEKQAEQDEDIVKKLDDFKSKGYKEMPSWEVSELIKGLSNDDLKISAMETYFNEVCSVLRNNPNLNQLLLMTNELEGITNVINSMDADNNKKLMIEKYLDRSFDFYKELEESQGKEIDNFYSKVYNSFKFNCILSLKDNKEELAKLQKDGKLEDYLTYERNLYKSEFMDINPYDVAENVKQLNSDEEKLEELRTGDIRKVIIANTHVSKGVLGIRNGINSLRSVICSFETDEMKLKAYEEIFKPMSEYDMNLYKDKEEIKSLIEENNEDNSFSIISSLKDKGLMIDKLIENEQIEKFLRYDYNVENKENIIENNIEKILEYYEIDDISSKKAMLLRMKESNSKVFEQMDYRLLEDKFLNTFSEHEINLIVNTDRVSIEEFCNYNEKELDFISSIIRNLDRQDDFNEYFMQVTKNLYSYKELVGNLDQNTLGEDQKQKLKNIIQYDNIFDIKTVDDLNNLENLKNEKLQEIINKEVKDPKGDYVQGVTKSDTVEEKKNAVLIKMFGIDYETARNIVAEFGEQTDKDKELKMIKNIVSLDHTYPKAYETDKILREIFNDERIQNEASLLSKIDIRKKYTSQYEEMYNDVLFKPEEGNLIEEKDGIQIYDAGTEFSILSTSVAAYSGTSDRTDIETNEKEMWCRKDLSANHFCGSFSRDDMIGIIPTDLGVYYGFSQIKQGSLLFMSAEDNQSSSNSINSNINGKRPFRNPDNMIEHTGGDEYFRRDLYNEFDIKREIEGVKQEPDYIIAIKVDGKMVNEGEAFKTAKDWDKEKPIVVLDIDRCLEKGITNINESIQEYDLNPNNENLKKVWENFHKTSITYGAFYKSKDTTKQYEDFLEKVNLPKALKDNIGNDNIKTYYYFLKDKNMFEKDIPLTQEENISEIREMMDDMYGNKTKTELTFDEIGKATLDSYIKNPDEENKIAQMVENEVERKSEISITK